MTGSLADRAQQIAEVRAELGPGDWPGEILRLRASLAEMTRCWQNALAALYRDDVETDPHLPSVTVDAITGMNFDWDDERAVQDIADTVARALQPAFGKLTQERDSLRAESEQRLGELLFWEFEYREAMDNYKGENWQVGQLRAELAQGREATHRAIADDITAHCLQHNPDAPTGWITCHCEVADDLRRTAPACTCGAEPVHQAGCQPA